MSEVYTFWQEYANMDMSHERFMRYCIRQKEKKVNYMCKPISAIRDKSAQELLEIGGQTGKIPVDIKSLLKKLGISCLPYDFTDLEIAKCRAENTKLLNPILGALVTNGDKAVIFYRKQDRVDSHRYRFTVAHEMGHCCLGHISEGNSIVHLSYRQEITTNDERETAANIFAGQLLIPKDALESVMEQLILPSVQTLAEVFAVSTNVMLERLKYLKVTANISGYNY